MNGMHFNVMVQIIWSYNFCTFRIGSYQLCPLLSINNKSIIKSGFNPIVNLNIPIL